MSMPSSLVNEVAKRRNDLRLELTQIEKQIYDLETTYIDETKDFGNIFAGWKNYLSYDKVKVKKGISTDERLFSLSSVTSPAKKAQDKKKEQAGSAPMDVAK